MYIYDRINKGQNKKEIYSYPQCRLPLILDQLVYMKMFLLIQNPNLYIFLGCFLITKIRPSWRNEAHLVSKNSAQVFTVSNG